MTELFKISKDSLGKTCIDFADGKHFAFTVMAEKRIRNRKIDISKFAEKLRPLMDLCNWNFVLVHKSHGSLALETTCLFKAFRTKEQNWFVWTYCSGETFIWVTLIDPKGTGGTAFSVVESYEGEEEAEKGHGKWVKLMRENPNRKLPSLAVEYDRKGTNIIAIKR